MSDVANDFSKCSIKEVEKQQVDRSYAIPMARLPPQVPENIQGTRFQIEFTTEISYILVGETRDVKCVYTPDKNDTISARATARPGKITGPAPRYNYGPPPPPVEATELRKTTRNPTTQAQYNIPNPAYPRKPTGCKTEDGEGVVEGPNGLQRKQEMYMARKVAAAQGGAGSLWY